MTGSQIAVITLCVLCAYTAGTAAQPPETFASAKKLAADIHEAIGFQVTVYCGCPYERKNRSGGDLDRDACDITARKNEKRSGRLEWEHVVPASWIGENHSCWSEGDAVCGRTTERGSRAGSAALSAVSTPTSWKPTTTSTTCCRLAAS